MQSDYLMLFPIIHPSTSGICPPFLIALLAVSRPHTGTGTRARIMATCDAYLCLAFNFLMDYAFLRPASWSPPVYDCFKEAKKS